MVFIYFLASVLCGFLAIHPYSTYPLSLWLIPDRYKKPLKPSSTPVDETYALCVCAYNEEAVIEDKIQNLLALKQEIPTLDVKIYVDAATDRTLELLQPYKDRFDIHVGAERHGKTHGMNLLVSKTEASIVVFTDANVIMDLNAIRNLGPYFADPDVGCVCGHLKYSNEDVSATASTGSLYWRLEEMIKRLEAETGSVIGADGSLFAIRRKLHTPPPSDLIDDMFVSLSILCDGYRVVRAEDVVAYEKSAANSSEEFKRKIRIACQAFNVHRALWPRLKNLSALNFYKYVSHKLLRWLTILWLFLAFVFFEKHLLAAGHSGLAAFVFILLAGFVVLTKFAGGKISRVSDIFLAFVATGIGVFKSLCGERYQTWSPAKSAR